MNSKAEISNLGLSSDAG